MAEFRSDEEQFDLVRSWWKDNGTQLLWGLAIVAAIVAGYRAYTSHVEEQAALASTRYDQFVDAFGKTDEGAAATRDFVLTQLKDEHADSGYVALAVFFDTQRLVEAGDLAAARTALEALVASGVADSLKEVAHLRLARVQWALGDTDAALKSLDRVPSAGLGQISEELRGDILLGKGDRDGARAAYAKAVTAAGDAVPVLLQMKLDDLAAAAGTAPEPASATNKDG